MKTMLISITFERFHRDGGYTIGLDTNGLPCTPMTGYMVGIPGPHAKTQVYPPNFYNVMAQFEAMTRLAQNTVHKLYAGAWFDGHNVWYLDISENILDVDDAIQVAQRRGELAIWDVANKKEIRV